ncbi:hypothetical protein BWQ96_08704 [Gracilariopsis chorda]|uniref:Uncharacterized protein n=1 Tax=Gracilariopsis chorda TaxID=448386 RepID=A0A2V3IHM0_9FLOR|nr:hypothetical protein BWQ96_08704 [Gracilariopsis chorda]|eukprot:PXF41559.1 hypothetical protein BWQ96_08704 [Gracilariopsis chorda]
MTDSDDDVSTAVAFMIQFVAQHQHTKQIFAAANSTAQVYLQKRLAEENDDEDPQQANTGRGNTIDSKKATYVSR